MLPSFFNLGSFSYTSRAGFIFIWGISLTHPMRTLFLCGEFLLHIPCCLHFYAGSFAYTSRPGFIFMQGVSLTDPVFILFFIFIKYKSGSFSYRSEWIRALQTTQKTTTLKIKALCGKVPRKRASEGCAQKRERSPTTP